MMKYLWIIIFSSVLIWSGVNPKDYFTWFLEVVPALLAVMVLAFTYKSFKFTSLLYVLILIHSIILMIGGHYTYAEVPLFDTLKDIMNWERNNYDKVGHLAQGLIPALVLREIVLRKNIINGSVWQFSLIVLSCLGLSAFYELVEWWVALAIGENAQSFLGTQGYVWDTQSDMGYALLGAIIGLLTLSKLHNKQLQNKLI